MIIREINRVINRVLKPRGCLAIIDHKFNNQKVESVIGQATKDLTLKETKQREDRKEEPILLFSKAFN